MARRTDPTHLAIVRNLIRLILWTHECDTATIGRCGAVRLVRLKPGPPDDDPHRFMRRLTPTSRVETPYLVLSIGQAFLTSDVIGMLIAAHHQHRGCGGEMVVCDLNPPAREVFTLCRLEKLIQVFPTEADAIDHLVTRAAGDEARSTARGQATVACQPATNRLM